MQDAKVKKVLPSIGATREMVSPFRYCGGKFYAVKHILPVVLAYEHDEYREPFVGGGTVFFAKPKVRHNWISDLEPDLITTYQVIADPVKRRKLIKKLSVESATKIRHAEIKNFQASKDIDVAFKTYYLNRTSYSGIIHVPAWGYKEGKSAPPSSWAKKIEPAGEKLEGVTVSNLDFEEVVCHKPVGQSVLMYLDPPYFNADQKRAYRKPFTKIDHERLASVLKSSKHGFCLSYDDCSEVRKLYSWANIHEASWIYASADCRQVQRKEGNELIITNYDIKISEKLGQLKLFETD